MADDQSEPPIPTFFQLTPMNPVYQENPHTVLDDLRERCPVRRDEQAGNFIFSKYNDVRSLLSDRTLWRDPLLAEEAAVMARRFNDAPIEGVKRSESASILTLDDPDHGRIRNPLAKAFYARVAKFRPQTEEIVDSWLDKMEGKETFDLMTEYAVPIPIDVIAAILGVDRARIGEFRDWSEGLIQGLNPFRTPEQTAHLERSSTALNEYFVNAMDERRGKPRDDLISDMVNGEGAALSTVEMRINLTALLVGGNLTTTDLIGNAVRLFLLNPGELQKLKDDPKLINSAVEEVLRFEGPIDITGRVASRDMEVRGCPVHQKAALNFSLRAANHDPEVFDDPHRFNITREHKPHMSFGGGAHICIGAPLARLEAQVALPKLFARFPNLAFANPDEKPVWRKLPFFRGLEKLELRA